MRDRIQELRQIAGQSAVLTSQEELAAYGGRRAFVLYPTPMAAVRISSAGQVQKLIRWGLDHKIPLVPVSSAAPHACPASAPSVENAVILDLSGMKQIRSINRRFCMAVLEPGVTYAELLPALARQGLRLSLPLAPRAGKSVVTSLLETEPRMDPALQWNHIDPLRCMEVVWGDGKHMLTGEAGGGVPDLEQQQAQGKWQINGSGPMMLDFCRLLTGAQGTMGVVTWASVKCEPLEQLTSLHLVPAARPTDLLGFVRQVLRLRFGSSLFVVNRAFLAALSGGELQTAPWQVVVRLCGGQLLPELRLKQLRADLSAFAREQGLELSPPLKKPSGSFSPQWPAQAERLFFVTTLARTPEFIRTMEQLAAQASYPFEQIGIYLQPQHQGVNCHCEFLIPYAGALSRSAEKLFHAASRAFAAMGAYYSRPYGEWADLQLAKDPAGAEVLRTVQGIFNPASILNPGKLGISWQEAHP